MFYRTDKPHGLPHDPFKSCVVPRPIAWVSTVHPNGSINLAPFSFFNAIASDPPMVMISFNGPHRFGGDKDTLSNIKATGEFVVNMVPFGLSASMNETCADVAPEVNEFELAGLHTVESVTVKPPRVSEAPIHLECVLHQQINLPCTREKSSNTMVIGKVLAIHIDDEVLSNGLVDLKKIRPLARLGYQQYTSVREVFALARPEDPAE